MEIKISNLPDDLEQYLQQKELITAKACYSNCMCAVMSKPLDNKYNLQYVLAKVTHPKDGISTSHALLKSYENYYDPTLEKQGCHDICSYEITGVYSRYSLIELMARSGKISEVELRDFVNGNKSWPILTHDGLE